MANTASKFYSVIVVGKNPQQLMEKYEIGKKVESYIKYRYNDAEKLKNNNISILSNICQNYKDFNLTKYQFDILTEKIKALKNMSPFEYYQTISYGCIYDENGDAWCDENPNGKWNAYQTGNHFSIPLITKDGKETMSALNKDIDWSKMHMANSQLYSLVWEMVKEGKEPSNDQEKQIYENMIDKDAYFSNFKDKNDYIIRNSAYWNYAYLDSNGWIDIDDGKGSDIEWINNFYSRFIEKIKPNDLVTIFEFSRETEEKEDSI